MNEDFSVSTIADRQAPTLARFDNLFQRLDVCLQFASTPRAATISLPFMQDCDLEQQGRNSPVFSRIASDLGSELSRIATNGLDVFTDTHEYLNKTRFTVGSWAKPNGPLHTLQADFGNPEAECNNQRLLKRVESEIAESVQYGTDIAMKFERWQLAARRLSRVLRPEQARLAKASDNILKDIETRQGEIKLAEAELANTRSRGELARESCKRIEQTPSSSLWTQLHIPKTPSITEFLYAVVSVGGAGIKWYTSKNSQIIIDDTHRDFERRMKIAEDMQRDILSSQASL